MGLFAIMGWIVFLYVLFVLFVRGLTFVCELIVNMAEMLRDSRARVDQLERIQLQHERTDHRVHLLACAETALALAPVVADPYDMRAAAQQERVLYVQYHCHSPLLRQPAIDGAIEMCAAYTTIAEKGIERLRAVAIGMAL